VKMVQGWAEVAVAWERWRLGASGVEDSGSVEVRGWRIRKRMERSCRTRRTGGRHHRGEPGAVAGRYDERGGRGREGGWHARGWVPSLKCSMQHAKKTRTRANAPAVSAGRGGLVEWCRDAQPDSTTRADLRVVCTAASGIGFLQRRSLDWLCLPRIPE